MRSKRTSSSQARGPAARATRARRRPVPKERLIPGEDRLVGQGVSYCATCDGPLFRGATVAAVGHAEEAVEDVQALLAMGCKILWVPGKAGEAAGGHAGRAP